MSYSAVVTTGIYCRPGCSARPNPENVEVYELAAAAEAAGFRACLRCRPYRTDEPSSWVGPELVCRAVQLILDGALDDGTEDDLGAVLGVSARHLRRVFTASIGVTPDQLARSRRVHFARRLLDDTDLSITDIAFAAGFGSVRQLNRSCIETFKATPRELRARRRRSDRLVADGGLAVRVPFTGPLAWDEMVAYLAARAVPGVERVEDGTYRRTAMIDGDPGVLEVSRGGDDHLVLRAHLPHWEGLIHVVQRARRIFGLDANLAEATASLRSDPTLRRLIARRPGLRVPGTWDPFEVGVRAILGQQVSVAGATTIAGRLVEAAGVPVPGLSELGLTHVFPTPEALTGASLEGIGLTSARRRTVQAFAAAAADGAIELDQRTTLDELTTSLASLPGVGPWTAQYIALRCGHPDACPVTDLGLRRSWSTIAKLDAAPASIADVAERWRPWRALAAAHLWMAGA